MEVTTTAPASMPSAAASTVTAAEVRPWEAYLDARSPAPLYFRHAWDRAFKVYGLEVIRLMAVREGHVVGVLPLVQQKSLIFGNHLVSLPWFDLAGVLADDEEARQALVNEALKYHDSLGSRTVELRQRRPDELSPYVRLDKVLMRLALKNDAEELWTELKAKVRNQVRKAEKSGLTVEAGGFELLAEFYDVYSKNMRDLGSPSHSRRFFQEVVDAFSGQVRLYIACLNGRAIGAGLTITNGDRVEIPWASSLREYNHLCVNHLMYWTAIRDACHSGFRWFNFGRSTRDSGTYHFKQQWGAEEYQLYWYYLGEGASDAANTSGPDSFGWAVAAWRRLPVWLSRRLGPFVIAKVA